MDLVDVAARHLPCGHGSGELAKEAPHGLPVDTRDELVPEGGIEVGADDLVVTGTAAGCESGVGRFPPNV